MATVTYDKAEERGRPQGEDRTRRGLIVRLGLIAVLLGLVGGGLWYYDRFRDQATADFFAGNVPPPTPIAAQPAEIGPQARWLEGIGTISAIRQVTVAPEVAGRVNEILFESGAVVTAGQPLVQLNDAIERAELRSFEALARLAEANLARTQRLARSDFATRATLDQNQAQLDQARANMARTRATIDQKRIEAPFAGRLGIRQVEPGQYVGPGTTLVSLTDLDTLYVDFTLPEQSRAQVEVGQTVEIRVDAFPERVFEAKLATIEPQIDPSTRTIQLQATMANPGGILLPGMFAQARLVLPPAPEVVTVPETAVIRTLYGDAVFLVREEEVDGQTVARAHQTFVRTGQIVDGRTAILEGVRAGDLVVASGQVKLQDGAPVQVTDDRALAMPAQPPRQ